jgi:hypothetical protein
MDLLYEATGDSTDDDFGPDHSSGGLPADTTSDGLPPVNTKLDDIDDDPPDLLSNINEKKRKLGVDGIKVPVAKRPRLDALASTLDAKASRLEYEDQFPIKILTSNVEKLNIHQKYNTIHKNKRILPECLAALVVLKHHKWNLENKKRMLMEYKIIMPSNKHDVTIEKLFKDLCVHKYDLLEQYGPYYDAYLLCKYFFKSIYEDILFYIENVKKANVITESPIIVPMVNPMNMPLSSFELAVMGKVSYLQGQLMMVEGRMKMLEDLLFAQIHCR